MLDTMEPPLPPGEVNEQLQLYKKVFLIYPLTPAVSLEAVRALEEHSFWSVDAQIWTTAKLNQVPTVLSEDVPVRVAVEGVTFDNPPAEEFDLGELSSEEPSIAPDNPSDQRGGESLRLSWGSKRCLMLEKDIGTAIARVIRLWRALDADGSSCADGPFARTLPTRTPSFVDRARSPMERSLKSA
jgi:hypothetical protein